MKVPEEITIRILRDLGRDFTRRSGLIHGQSLTLLSLPSAREGHVWVMCPPVTRRVRGETMTRSDGWYELEAGEWEEVKT